MTPSARILLASSALGLALAQAAPALAMDGVVASIKPVHSLVAAVMDGVGEPDLIIAGAGSPHTYAMRPSDARKLEQARLIFWVGHGLETFLEQPLETLGGDATVVTLEDAADLVKLEYREGGAFEQHDDHEGHDEESGEAHDDHAHAEEAHTDEAHDDAANEAGGGHDGHDHGAYDLHLWLDPRNAKAMVAEIETALAAADPDNAARYAKNAAGLTAKIDALSSEIETEIASVKDKPFVTFHDAYHYFENRFGLQSAGTITVSPDVVPGAQRVAELQTRVGELGATCVFAEPQFEPRIISVVTEGTEAKSGVLDPLGADIADGPDLYFTLMRNLATSFKTCLSTGS